MLNMDDILFETKEIGENVIKDMNKVMDKYGTVSVADLYDICGLTSSYKEYRHGWTDISSAKIVNNKNGYLLQIDRPITFE